MSNFLEHKGRAVRDADWVGNMFAVSVTALKKEYQFLAHTSTAHSKFTDNRIGGNWAINMPPAFTRTADPRQSGLAGQESGVTKPRGMGDAYSTMIDDNSHNVHFCCGVAAFRGMLSFFVGMGNMEAAIYARLGRVPITFLMGKVAGIYTSMRFLPLLLVGAAGKFLLNRSSSKYYSFKPTMHSYWKRVDFIANTIAVNIGLYQKYDVLDWGKREFEGAGMDGAITNTKAEYKQLVDMAHQAAPDLFRKRGGVDIYQMVTRTQRLAMKRRELLENTASKITSREELYRQMIHFEYKARLMDTDREKSTLDNLLKIHNEPFADANAVEDTSDALISGHLEKDKAASATADNNISIAPDANATTSTTNADGTTTPAATPTEGDGQQSSADINAAPEAGIFNRMMRDPTVEGGYGTKAGSEGLLNKWWESLSANYHGAFEWFSFRVNHTGSISASFSNSTKEAEISTMINGFSSLMASGRFTLSGGKTGIVPVDSILSGITNMAKGFVAGFDAAGIINLAGSAYVDIPEHWDNSSTEFPSESFKMELRTPYANKLSRFIKLYIPQSMAYAMSLPISTGRQQYGSPYMLQVFSPGRMSCKLAMVSSLSVDIGVGNIGYNDMNQPLAFDISMTIKDMNKTMHAPIDTGASLLNPFRAIFDDDNPFNDYMNVISALSMADQVIPTRKLSRKVAVQLNQWDSYWSMGNWTMGAMDSTLGRATKNLVTLAGMAGVPGVSVPQLNRSLAQ